MVDLMYCLTNLLFFDIPLSYYYYYYYYYYCTNLNSSIISCIFSGDIYLSFGISSSLLTTFKLFFEDFVILSAILLSIKAPVASAVFWITLFEAVFIASVLDFWHYQEVFDYTYCSCF